MTRLFCFVFIIMKVLTKDSVTVSVDAVVYYRVSNATVSIANVENAHHSTRLLAQTTLRNTMGTRHLHEILSERMTISGTMQIQLDEVTDAWGIKVERVEMLVSFVFLAFKTLNTSFSSNFLSFKK